MPDKLHDEAELPSWAQERLQLLRNEIDNLEPVDDPATIGDVMPDGRIRINNSTAGLWGDFNAAP